MSRNAASDSNRSSWSIPGDHPLSIELSSLRSALAHYQNAAHSASMQLQGRSFEASLALEKARRLEHANHVLESELNVLRTNSLPIPATSSSQTHELTLALRRLNAHLDETEKALGARIKETKDADAARKRAEDDKDRLKREVEVLQEKEKKIKHREMEVRSKQKQVFEERKLLEDLAKSVSSMTAQEEPPPVNLDEEPPQLKAPPYTFPQARQGLQKLMQETSSETMRLESELARLHALLEARDAELDAERRAASLDRERAANAEAALESARADDRAAAGLVDRYMKFSQSTTDALHGTLSTLQERHAATVSSLQSQLAQSSKMLARQTARSEALRRALDELTKDVVLHAEGRRREVAMRLSLVAREERWVSDMRRWVGAGGRQLKKYAAMNDNAAEKEDVALSLQTTLDGARSLLERIDGSQGDHTRASTAVGVSEGSVARIVAAEEAVTALITELQEETAKRMELERERVDLFALRLSKDAKDTVFWPSEKGNGMLPHDGSAYTDEPRESANLLDGASPIGPDLLSPDAGPEAQGSLAGRMSGDERRPDLEYETGQLRVLDGVPDGRVDVPSSPSGPVCGDLETPLPPVEMATSPTDDSATSARGLVPLSMEQDAATPGVIETRVADAHRDNVATVALLPSGVSSAPTLDGDSQVQETFGSSVLHYDNPLHLPIASVEGAPSSGAKLVETSLETSQDADQTPSSHELLPSSTMDDLPDLAVPPDATKSVSITKLPDSMAPADMDRDDLLKQVAAANARYDTLQSAFKACHTTLSQLKSDLLSPPTPSSPESLMQADQASVLSTAVNRLDDITEDTRVSLEIRIIDDARLAKGLETLLAMPASDPIKLQLEVEAFVGGKDHTGHEVKESFEKKLDDLEHDIAIVKRAVHEWMLGSALPTPTVPDPKDSRPADGTLSPPSTWAWTSTFLPSQTSSPAPPTPTFGAVMSSSSSTKPRSFSSAVRFPGLGPSPANSPDLDPFASLGLRHSMPSHPSPAQSSPPSLTPIPSNHSSMHPSHALLGFQYQRSRTTSGYRAGLGSGLPLRGSRAPSPSAFVAPPKDPAPEEKASLTRQFSDSLDDVE